MKFMSVEQYQFVKKQAKKIINAYTTSKDQNVIEAVQALVQEEINNKLTFNDIEEQLLLQPIFNIQTKEQLDQFSDTIKQYVEPFIVPTDNQIKKLFPKDKKVKLPNMDIIDLKEVSYLSWVDSGTNRKYIVYYEEGILKGVRGVFTHSEKMGICSVCNQHSKVGLLLVSKNGAQLGTYTKRGNYICENSESCNEALTDFNHFIEFVDNLK
nr:FusB/FusC family EF-G-binding protein [Lysinibacillus timonensis]